MRLLVAVLLVFTSFAAFASSYTYVGIGIALEKKKNKTYEIIGLLENGPALKAGAQVGDAIIAVDGKPSKEMKLDELVANLSGDKAGTTVAVDVQYKNQSPTRTLNITRERLTVECFMEGNVSLNLYGSPESGSLNGYVGSDSLSLNVFGGRASGFFKGESVDFEVYESAGGYNSYEVRGWVHNSYVTWRGFGGSVTGYQSCIP